MLSIAIKIEQAENDTNSFLSIGKSRKVGL